MSDFCKSWGVVLKTLKSLNVDGGLRELIMLVRKIQATHISEVLYATTSHDCLNISHSHRHDAKCDVIRICCSENKLNLVYFRFDVRENEHKQYHDLPDIGVDEAYGLILNLMNVL